MNQSTCVSCGAISTIVDRPPVNGFYFHRCSSCTLVFIPLSQLKSTIDYDTLYDDQGLYAVKLSETNVNRLPPLNKVRVHAMEVVAQVKPKKVLEIGCGTGAFLKRLQLMGIDCYGVEPSRSAAERAREFLKAPIENSFFCSASHAGELFDAVFAWEVLEHVHDVGDFLKNVNSLLTPSGHLFLSTPNYQSTWMWDDIPRDPNSAPPVHVTFWNERAMRAYLSSVFKTHAVQHFSVPCNAAIRSKQPLARYIVYLDALLRPKSRSTLGVVATKSL